MTTQEILRAARALPPHEQLVVLEGLAQSLAHAFAPFGRATAEFWEPRALEAVARERHTPAATDISALAMPDWPRDETADDFVAFMREQRRQDAQES